MTKLIETGARRVPMNPQIAAEAAAWIAHMHGPNRTEETERDLLKWQALSSVHREAFEWCTDVWQDVVRISNASALLGELPEGITAAWPGRKPRAPAPRARKYAAALALVGVFALALFLRPPGETAYRTAVGEQRHIELEDGSRMFMNTDTRLRVTFNPTQRTIEVSSGEVFFEVAKDARRQFVVRIAGSEVVAVGTAFAVRYAPTGRPADELAVTLVEGHVKVRSVSRPEDGALAPTQPVLMAAGERLVLDRVKRAASAAVVAEVDRPNVEQVLAWKVREASFDDTPLEDAVSDMNRYSKTPIVLTGRLSTSELRVSGMYRVDDTAGFARALAALHHLTMDESHGRFELSRPN